jgi:hypothetical protein
MAPDEGMGWWVYCGLQTKLEDEVGWRLQEAK